jgi:hypothetical protein
MRKLALILILSTFLAGCSLWQKNDFISLYTQHVEAQFSTIKLISKFANLMNENETKWSLKVMADMPAILSGSLALDYLGRSSGTDTSLALEKVNFLFESIVSSGSLSLKNLDLISKSSDLYASYAGLSDVWLLTPELRKVFTDYSGKWLSWTQADANSYLSGSSAEDVAISRMSENISQMKLSDIEAYLIQYPLWKQTDSIGMQDGYETFSVILDRDHLMSILESLTLDLTGSGMTTENRANLLERIQAYTVSGKIGFDPANARKSKLALDIGSSSGTKLGIWESEILENGMTAKLISLLDKTEMNLSLISEDSRSDLKMIVTQSGTEIANISGYSVRDGRALRELSLEATAAWVSVIMKHNIKSDGKFDGRLMLPVWAISWNGSVERDKLTALSIKWALPTWSVDMTLAPVADKLSGPLIVVVDGIEAFRANIGLLSDTGHFALSVDVPPIQTGALATRGSIDLTYASTRWTGDIRVPSPLTPLRSLLDAIDQVSPVVSDDVFTEEIPGSGSIQSNTSEIGWYAERSRDAKRSADLMTISTTLSAYYADNEKYPPQDPSGCLPILPKIYFVKDGFPKDPVWKISTGCDGSNGETYSYRTGIKDGNLWFAVAADFENATGWNSSVSIDTATLDAISKWSGKYYIVYN